MVICLALALAAAGVMSLAVSEERGARADWRRTRSEYALEGARLLAAQALLESANKGRTRWMLAADGGPFEVVAEPEAAKLSLGAASNRPDVLAAFAPVSPGRLSSALQADASQVDLRAVDVAAADDAPQWRLCAPSYISPWGQAAGLAGAKAVDALAAGSLDWRLGQLWRIRVTDPVGWTDDSVVRFTGDARHPIAVAARRFTHRGPMGSRCDFIAQDMTAR